MGQTIEQTLPNADGETRTATLLISEIYASIQGESTHAGRPCVFVRLTGCPLRCVWCDSAFAFSGGRRMPLDDILAEVAVFGIGLVEVTGGEPLAQADCLPLLKKLCDAGYEVLLETSGALEISGVDARVAKIIDVKCPGSGESERNCWENLRHLGPRDEIKLVIALREDYDWARGILERFGLGGTHAVHFSPAAGLLEPAELAAWLVEDKVDARLQLQLHKKIWPERTRGV